MKRRSLLERAQETAQRKTGKVPREWVTASIAWVRGEVTTTQLSIASGQRSGTGAVYRIAAGLREAYRLGLIKDGKR